MRLAKIEFASDADAAKALHGIMRRGGITGLRDGTFIMPGPALAWLDSQHIHYTIVQRLNQDDVVQTLRDHLAEPV